MKKSDIATITLIAGFSIIVSYFVVSALPMFQNVSEKVEVPTATPIVVEDIGVDKDVFNSDALNPTVEITIDTPDDTPVDVNDNANNTQGQ